MGYGSDRARRRRVLAVAADLAPGDPVRRQAAQCGEVRAAQRGDRRGRLGICFRNTRGVNGGRYRLRADGGKVGESPYTPTSGRPDPEQPLDYLLAKTAEII